MLHSSNVKVIKITVTGNAGTERIIKQEVYDHLENKIKIIGNQQWFIKGE